MSITHQTRTTVEPPVKPATRLAILYADRGDRRKSPGEPGAAIAIFADRRDRRIKSPISGMSDIDRRLNSPVPAIFYAYRCESLVKSTNQVGRFSHMNFLNAPRWSPGTKLKCRRRKKSPSVSASIGG